MITAMAVSPACAVSLNANFKADELIIESSVDWLTNGYEMDITGTLDVQGTLIATDSSISVGGNWDASGVSVILGVTTVTFDGVGAQTITTAGTTFNDFILNSTSSTATWTLQDDIDIDGTVGFLSGTLISNNYHVNIADDTTVGTEGGFTKGSGTVYFDGTATIKDNTSVGMNWGKVRFD